MNKKHYWRHLYTAIVSAAIAGLSGCQTWVPDVGMTLPSGHYLHHRPQYIPRSPEFPLSRELATMEQQAAAAPGAAPAPAIPGGPIPPGGAINGGVPAPAPVP